MSGPAAYTGPPPTIVLDTEVEYPNSTYDLVVIRSGGIDKARVDKDGNWIGGGFAPPSYGGTYEFNESGSAIAMASSVAFYRWVTGQAGTVKGAGYVTWDDSAAPTGKRLTIGSNGAGVYLVHANFSGVLTAKGDLEAVIYVNANIQNNIRSDQKVVEDSQYTAGALGGLLTLAAGDTVTLWFGASTNSATFTIKHANLTLLRVG